MSRRAIRKLVTLSPSTVAAVDDLRHSKAMFDALRCPHCGHMPGLPKDGVPSETQVLTYLVQLSLDRRDREKGER